MLKLGFLYLFNLVNYRDRILYNRQGTDLRVCHLYIFASAEHQAPKVLKVLLKKRRKRRDSHPKTIRGTRLKNAELYINHSNNMVLVTKLRVSQFRILWKKTHGLKHLEVT